VGLFDSIMGRRKPTGPKLDALFALPSAAITLEVELGFVPTGSGSVAFRAPEGRAFADLATEVRELLDADSGPPVEVKQDDHGFTWVVVHTAPPDVSSIVTDLHAVNSSLADAGFGPQLLCSLVAFRNPEGRALALIYLYKRGAFYPFAPLSGEDRDNVMELQVREALKSELPLEADLGRWFAVWGAPGL